MESLEVGRPNVFKLNILSTPEYNSGSESVYSIQGYETAIVRDFSSGSLSSFSDVNVSDGEGGNFDSVYFDNSDNEAYYLSEVGSVGEIISGEDHYDIEYDIASIVSSKKSGGASSEAGSDVDGNVIALLHCVYEAETDLEFWADSSNCEDSSTDDDPDITDGDKWQCLHCRHCNWPTYRFCQKCWQVRKNWLPQQRRRPPKRLRRKRSKHEFSISSKRRRLNYAVRQRTDTISSNDEFCNDALRHEPFVSSGERRNSSLSSLQVSGNIQSSSQEDVPVSESVASLSSSQSTTATNLSLSQEELVAPLSCSQSTVEVHDTSSQQLVAESQNEVPVCIQSTIQSVSTSLVQQAVNCKVSSAVAYNRSLSDSGLSSPQEDSSASPVDVILPSSQEYVAINEVYRPSIPSISCRLTSDNNVLSPPPSSQEQVASPAKVSATTNDMQKAVPHQQLSSLPNCESTLCLLCASRTKNACISHGSFGHLLTCFKCAQRLFQNEQPCPFCRRNIRQVIRVLELG